MKRKYTLLFLFFVVQLAVAQNPVVHFWQINRTPASWIWDATPWNNQIDNGSGGWTDTGLTWASTGGGFNRKWTGCKDAIFGGNTGVGAAGTVTLATEMSAKGLYFRPASGGNFLITGSTITGSICTTNMVIDVASGLSPGIGSVLGGTNGIEKKNSGRLILSGDNTYSGTTTISQGILQVGSGGTNGTLGTGAVMNNAGLEINRSNDYIIGNLMSGSGTFDNNGNNTTIFTDNNTYTGITSINAGTLQLGNNTATGNILNSGSIVAAPNTNLSFKRTDNITFSRTMSGAGNMIQAGSGTTTLNLGNTFTGSTFFNAGKMILDYGSVSPIMSSSSKLVFNGGALQFDNLAANTQTFNKTTINSTTTSKIIRGTNYTAGSGLLDLGDLSLVSGTLDVSDITTTPGWVKCNVINSYGLLGGSVTTDNNTILGTDANGYLIVPASSDYSQGGLIADSPMLNIRLIPTGIGGNVSGGSVSLVTGAGTTNVLSLSNMYSATNGKTYIPLDLPTGGILRVAANGGITNARGTTLQIQGAGTLTAGGTDNSNGKFSINATNAVNLNVPIANNGTGVVDVVKAGAGILTLNAVQNFTGTFTANAGDVYYGSVSNYLGNASSVIINNSTLNFLNIVGGFDTTFGNKLTLNNGNITSRPTGNGDGTQSISTPVEILGTCSIRYGLGHTYQQSLYIRNGLIGDGTVNIGDDWTSNPHGIYLNGDMSNFNGIINVPTYNAISVDIESVNGWGTGATLIVNAGNCGVNYSGQFTNRLGQTKVAADVTTLTNKLIVNGGNFYTSYNLTIGSLSGTGGIVTIPASKKVTTGALNLTEDYRGVIAGSGSFVKEGTGTMTISGANTYTGTTTINGGTLVAGSTTAFGTGTITINAGGTLNMGGFTLTNTIVNNGGTVIP